MRAAAANVADYADVAAGITGFMENDPYHRPVHARPLLLLHASRPTLLRHHHETQISDQGIAAIGPILSFFKLPHMDKATLQFEARICASVREALLSTSVDRMYIKQNSYEGAKGKTRHFDGCRHCEFALAS